MTSTVFTVPELAEATAGLLGYDWQAAPVGPWNVSGFISHRDGKHDGFTIAVDSYGDLYVQDNSPDPTVLQCIGPGQGLARVADAVADIIRMSLAEVPLDLDLNGPLPLETLRAVQRKAERLVNEYTEKVLPRHVNDAVLAVLREETLAEHGAPLAASFDTTEQDEGYVPLADETRVHFADGHRCEVELDWKGQCRNLLVDYGLSRDLNDDDVLTVTFDPPCLSIV